MWEAFAERMETEQLPVSVVKVDCMANRNLCMEQKVQAFPLLRLFRHGAPQPPDYRSDRTLEALTEFVSARLAQDHQLELMPPAEKEAHLERKKETEAEHPRLYDVWLSHGQQGKFTINVVAVCCGYATCVCTFICSDAIAMY